MRKSNRLNTINTKKKRNQSPISKINIGKKKRGQSPITMKNIGKKKSQQNLKSLNNSSSLSMDTISNLMRKKLSILTITMTIPMTITMTNTTL